MTAARSVTRVVAALLALALLAGALLTLVELILAALDRRPWVVPHAHWRQWLVEHSWDDATIRAVLVGLVVIGLVLILLGLRRGRPGSIELPPDLPGVHVRASRRSVEMSLAAAAARVTGVTDAQASAGRRSVRVTARTLTSQPELQQHVTAAVAGRLESFGLDRMRARVRTTSKEER